MNNLTPFYILPFPVHFVAVNDKRFWKDVWVSKEFKSLIETNSWLDKIIPLLASKPIGFFNPPENSRFYFSALFMNSVMLRNYDNKLIQDLYVLHEALHCVTIDYYLNSLDLKTALRLNEIEVSLETECWVYLREPSWIGKTFDLWIEQNHIKDNFNKPVNLELNETDINLLNARNKIPWPIDRDDRDKNIYLLRRLMNNYPKTNPDFLVKKYEDLSNIWIKRISKDLGLIHSLRKQFSVDCAINWKSATQNYLRQLNKNLYDGLPFGNLKP